MQSINHILAYAGIGCLFVILGLMYDLRGKRLTAPIIRRWGTYGALIVTVCASGMTLIYSEYFGLIPCGLCWMERIMLYPQILLIGGGLYYKDKLMPRYGIILSIVGLLVSLYHHYIQMGGSQFIKCPTAGTGADCARRFFFEFGFITFPLMSAILFTFLIVLYIYILKVSQQHAN